MGWTIEQAFIEIDTIRTRLKKLSGSLSGYVKTSAIKNNLTTTAAGNVLDARQGKTLDNKISEVYLSSPITVSCRVAGYITDNAKIVSFTLPVTNPIPATYTGGTFALTGLQLKGVSGNISATVADLTATITGITVHGINVNITNTDGTAFSATNNTPISAYIAGTITLS